MPVSILHGDCRPLLRDMDAETFHSCVTDPPYHLIQSSRNGTPRINDPETPFGRTRSGGEKGFMGKTWDGGDVAFRPETWAEVLRVMKPGAFMVAFASTRGYHRMTCAIEDAGFIIHPMLGWMFGSGFPKATRFKDMPELDGWRYGLQALKPAFEPICLAQKPMVGTGPENWRAHGCGGLHVDACRVPSEQVITTHSRGKTTAHPSNPGIKSIEEIGRITRQDMIEPDPRSARWPPNLLHDGSDEVLAAFGVFGEGKGNGPTARTMTRNAKPDRADGYGMDVDRSTSAAVGGDTGTAARFFPALPFTQDELRFHYSGKATADDRAGSKHPTIKPLALMKWLCTLITPPGGHILDPFAGSGTTGEAARLLGFDCTLIEQDASHVADINRRLGRAAGNDTPLFAEVSHA